MIKILFDKFFEFFRVRQENREKLFKNFLKPAYESFEKAHHNYLETFQQYRDVVCNNDNMNTNMLDELKGQLLNDSRFHHHLRSAAIQEAETLESSKRYNFMPFINRIRKYFEGPIEGKSEFIRKVNQMEKYSNSPRAALFMAIEFLSYSLSDEKVKIQITSKEIDELIWHIQKQKEKIHREYLKAKKKLMVM